MNREQQEMAVWREAYMLAISQGASYGDADEAATTAAESFRKRYPVEPTAPAPVWYDEPPFDKIDKTNYCWVQDIDSPQAVYWSNLNGEWRFFEGVSDTRPLNRRRVSPITKPPEPPQ